MKRVKQRQLKFVFADSSKESDDAEETKGVPEVKAWLLRIAKVKKPDSLTTPVVDTGQLLKQASSMPNLARALLNVARNKGAAGVDGISVEEAVKSARSLLSKVQHELLTGKHRPGNIRRVWIPRAGGGKRGLGIPKVRDRLVQQAVLQVLEPVFEPSFHNSSHGFRPNRGTKTAISEARRYAVEGFRIIVDIDLSKFFDRVNHQRLLNRLAQRVKDKRVLKLIHLMLKSKVVMPDGTKVSLTEGAPQGGPLSPLLSNIVLDELDKQLEWRGLRFVRYADDLRIYVRSKRAGQRVMNSISQFIERRLRLKVNDEKSSIIRFNQGNFLGFRLSKDREGKMQIHLSDRSIKRIYAKVREMTPRVWGQSLKACIEQLNTYLKGWEAYFGICTIRGVQSFKKIDAHIRRRLRMIIIKQKKRARYLYRHLLSRGVLPREARMSAYTRRGYWAKSHTKGIDMAYQNSWFALRLESLWTLWENKNIEPVRVLEEQLKLPLYGTSF